MLVDGRLFQANAGQFLFEVLSSACDQLLENAARLFVDGQIGDRLSLARALARTLASCQERLDLGRIASLFLERVAEQFVRIGPKGSAPRPPVMRDRPPIIPRRSPRR